MHSFTATRTALLTRRNQIALAVQARKLLEEKRAALVKELLRGAENAVQSARVLQETADQARRMLARAEAMAGSEAVQAAALAARAELSLEFETLNLMGVEVPRIEQKRVVRSALGRGYAITGTSSTIDEAAAAFEVEVETILQLAEGELRLARLSREIQHTSRQLNALDHLVIPRLQRECRYIQMILDERERYDNFRLRLAKRFSRNRRQ